MTEPAPRRAPGLPAGPPMPAPSESPIARVCEALDERITHLQGLRESLEKEFGL